MRISDWSSDVCSSDLENSAQDRGHRGLERLVIRKDRRNSDTEVDPSTERERIRSPLVELGSQRIERKSVVVGKECVSTCRSRWSSYHYKIKETLKLT